MSIQHSQNRFRSPANPDTNNATYLLSEDVFGYFEADYRYLNKQSHYQHLKEINAGRNTGLNWYNDRDFTYEMASDFIDALSAHLDLTPKERSQALGYFVNLDRETLGLESHLVAYCVCAYVVEKNERNDERRCHPNVPDEKEDGLFQQIADTLNLNQKAIVKTYGKIESRVPETAPPVRDDNKIEHHLHGDGGI